jgi:hypothetical protein
MVLGLDMGVLGGKWQKKNKDTAKHYGLSHLDPGHPLMADPTRRLTDGGDS